MPQMGISEGLLLTWGLFKVSLVGPGACGQSLEVLSLASWFSQILFVHKMSVRAVLKPSRAKCRWGFVLYSFVLFSWMQRLWTYIFRNLALTLTVSALALEDYINGNSSCPGPATGQCLSQWVFTGPPLSGGTAVRHGAGLCKSWLCGCKPASAPCKVSWALPVLTQAACHTAGSLPFWLRKGIWLLCPLGSCRLACVCVCMCELDEFIWCPPVLSLSPKAELQRPPFPTVPWFCCGNTDFSWWVQ